MPGPPSWDYQYHLKDHLGNVRITFTTKQQVDTYTATLETAHEETESADFNPSYDNATIINSSLYNHTASGSKSQRLSAANADEIVGLARSLSVMPGDTVHIKVYGKYYTPTNTNSNAAASMLVSMAQAFGVSGSSTGEGLKAYNRLNEMFGSGFFLTSEDWEDDEAPKAFLNYILFDKDFVPYDMGWDQIDASALETGTNVAHDELTLMAPVTQAGYIYIYLSNENTKLVDVYFDDLTIEHKLSPVVQQDDYYAFGLTFNSYSRENSLKNKMMKFQGQEHITDLDLGWDSFKWRNHMPDIGRFFNVDPLADKYVYNSPYAFSENKVVAFVELEGLEAANPPTPTQESKRRHAEQSFAIEHPTKALAIGSYKEGSSNISTVASNFAINATNNTDMTIAGEGSDRNALRHGIWQAMITQEFGKEMSAKAGYAHEGYEVPEVQVTEGGYSAGTLPEADGFADLLNNKIGQKIGEDNPNATNVGLALQVLDEFKNNGMWTVQETENGFLITKTKITEEQYGKARDTVQRLGENGLSKKKNEEDGN